MSQDKGNFKGRRNRNQGFNKNRNQPNIGDRGKEILAGIDENNPVIKQFQEYASELDTKHDRHERLVKISRDITIESKRIIFLLHTLDKESKRNTVLAEAETRLNNLIKVLFKNIAQELDGEDSYLYLRAFRPGIQEFVEAITFYWFLQNNTLYNWTNLESSMKYSVTNTNQTETSTKENENSTQETETSTKENEKSTQETESSTNESESNTNETESKENPEEKKIKCLLPPVEYILGIADLTGELMRKCINNLASGDISSCYQTCEFVRNMYKGFLGVVGVSGREVSRKLYTLRQSLLKMENVCYTIQVRGSEIPKHMLAEVAFSAAEEMDLDDDEGYHVY